MEIVVAAFSAGFIFPAVEANSLFESCIAFLEKFSLGDANALKRSLNRRKRALANAENAYVRRFDQRNSRPSGGGRRERFAEVCRCKPTGCAAANNHDIPNHSAYSVWRARGALGAVNGTQAMW